MTTAGTSAAGWPRRRLLVALLVVSGLLNLFFIAGAGWTKLHGPGGWLREEPYQRMAATLELDTRQRAGFDKYVAAMRTRDRQMHQEVAPLIAGAWDEMAKPQADTAQIMRRFDDASQKWRQFQHDSTTATLEFLALLSPSQREKFIEIQRERRATWLRRRASRH